MVSLIRKAVRRVRYSTIEALRDWWRNPEEINGGERCPTYLYRWKLFEWRGRKVYLHRFVGDDWSVDLHDHPKRFVSIGLRGSYVERTDAGVAIWRAPWIRSFPAEHRHRITTPFGECWTLVAVGLPEREWGFWPAGEFVWWRAYVYSSLGDRGVACR